jgi:hypothetical protein
MATPDTSWIGPAVTAASITGPLALIGTILNALVTSRNAKRRETLEKDLDNLSKDFEREKMSVEHLQANRRPFLQKQLEICFEAVDTAARLASETNLKEWQIARTKFWRLYWGVLSIVEDRPVERAMIHIKNAMPKMQIKEDDLPITALEKGAYDLAHAARDLMSESWRMNLPRLKDT